MKFQEGIQEWLSEEKMSTAVSNPFKQKQEGKLESKLSVMYKTKNWSYTMGK